MSEKTYRAIMNDSAINTFAKAQAIIDAQAAELAALREAVEQAREILSVLCDTRHSIKAQYAARKYANAWLAAHPAQPQPQEEQAK